MEYRYNENGLLSLKKVYDDNGIDSDNYYYFWSDDGRLLAYTVDVIGSEDLYSVLVLYNSDKEPIGFTVDEDTYYYLKNIQGDVLCVTDAEGTPIVNYTYDAWGMITAAPASQNVSNTVLARVAFLNPVTYRGYLYDPELGFYYLQSRYYDPETGRFLNADALLYPSDNPLDNNVFSYCNGNPIARKDPSGFVSEIIIPIIGVPVSISAIVAAALSLLYLVDPNIRNATNQAIILLLVKAPGAIINAIKRIAQSVKDARAKPRTKKTNNHHIVAKNASDAQPARDIFLIYSISIDHKANIVRFNQNFHQHLHTKAYYIGVNRVLSKGNDIAKKSGVFAALLLLHGVLKLTNTIFF